MPRNGSRRPLGVAVVGTGYWGPNLIRNFQAHQGSRLLWVCDLDRGRARAAVGRHSTVRVTDSLDDVLSDPATEAVAIATPARTHVEIALACLESDRHVLLEKPLAPSLAEGLKLVSVAEQRGLVLMCDHTYCYTPAVRRIRELVRSGTVGEVQYVDSVRINLGLVQPDVDVLWDLAPHDLSILDFILPEGSAPKAVATHGADPIGAGRACVAYLTMPLPGGAIAHSHVNWLSPTKVRTTIVGGSRRTVVWDDLHPTQRLSMYDRGVERPAMGDPTARREALISYRVGDMVAPALQEVEALHGVVGELVAAVREGRPPVTDGAAGLRVLALLEAASRSLERGGATIWVGGCD
ncbi:MAG TPA: Gfo/Idh/MocA family oxidoreductase [Actinomycetes bacterium]|nr:Gfo/Idh/MocA family oxidoreductase [Actinomycetes bacterium]